MNYVCKICGLICKGYKGLGTHVYKLHKLTAEEYYLQYLAKPNEEICELPQCNNKCQFINLAKGFRRFCNRECKIKYHREVIKCKECGKEFERPKSYKTLKYCSEACRKAYRKKHPEEFGGFKKKPNGTHIVRCETCGKLVKIKHAQYIAHKHHFCSIKCTAQYYGKLHSGENHWNWKGGKTEEAYKLRHSEQYEKWRMAVYRRDHWTCQMCGKKTKQLVAHHIKPFKDYPELRYDVSNGITLCRNCHKKVHGYIGKDTRFKKGQVPHNKKLDISKEELTKLYWQEGLSLCEIGKKFGVGRQVIRSYMIKYNIPRRNLSQARQLSVESGRWKSPIRKVFLTKKELYDLYWNQNLSLSRIGKLYRISTNNVLRWMRRYGIKTRNYTTNIQKK